MFKKIILAVFFLSSHFYLFCNQAEDDRFKKQYSVLPKDASNVKVIKQTLDGDFVEYFINNGIRRLYIPKKNPISYVDFKVLKQTLKGCFVEYFDNGSRLVYIPKKGDVKNFKKDVIHAAIFSSSNIICEEALEKIYPTITCFNDCDQAAGYMIYIDKENVHYFPFFWSPAQCNILPNLNNNSFTSLISPISINNYGIIVGYGLKSHERTLYLGDKKIEKKLMCRDSIPVVWPNLSTIKEICLFDDKNDNLSYLGVKNGRPYHITIDDDNFIHFWFDSFMSEPCGSIHLSELE